MNASRPVYSTRCKSKAVASSGNPKHRSRCYKPVTKKTGDYPRHLRVKVNTTGLQAARYWDQAKKRISALEDHAGLLFTAKVAIRALWFADDAWGLVVEATDLMLQEEISVECPF